MKKNRGKDFEQVIKKAFASVPNVSVDRIPDQMSQYKGSTNICDFIVYRKPYQYYIECKCVYGNTFPLSRISQAQAEGLLKKAEIDGVKAGVIVWWIDKDVTRYIPIWQIECIKQNGYKSIHWNTACESVWLQGKKSRVYFSYDMEQFFKEVENGFWN